MYVKVKQMRWDTIHSIIDEMSGMWWEKAVREGTVGEREREGKVKDGGERERGEGV